MSFPAYEYFQESSCRWLGEFPTHWESKPLWTMYRRTKRTGYGDEQLLSVYRDYGVIPKSSRDDNFNKPSDDLSPYQLVEPSDLVINKMKAWQGSVAISECRGIVSPAYHVYESLHDQHSRYLHYLMRSPRYITGYLAMSKGIRVNQWDLEPQLHSRMPVLLPPLPEQRTIAAFLDAETSKIDGLVSEQRRLIELLKEKRQAVISHAVTKGLNPDVKMKPSGIEWLGDVPEHWECVRNKAVFREVDDRSKTEEGELLTVSHITGVTPRAEKDVNMFMPETFVGYKQCLRGDLVINTMWAWMGALGCTQCDGIVSPSYNVYRPKDVDLLWPDYYDDLCRVPSHRTAIKSRSKGVWESRLRLYPDAFLGMSMPLPPFDEQQAIAAFVDCQTSHWDSLASEASRAIELLQERRTALISAAVTGKIDVRGYTPEEAVA